MSQVAAQAGRAARNTQTGGHRQRILRALELPSLVLVPLAMLVCAWAGLDVTGGLILAVVALSLVLFFASYEASRPTLRQIMPTATLGAVAAAGRIIFAPVPDVKPVSAIAITAGATLGRQDGFLVGAIAALVSNFFFGQGAWTPMQMYAWGLVGYLSGVLADAGAFGWDVTLSSVSGGEGTELTAQEKSPGAGRGRHGVSVVLLVWGFASGLLYGLLLNGWYVLGYVRPLSWGPVFAAFAAGLPLDCVHGVATAVFLALIWVPWGRSIRRVVAKYNL